MNCVKVFKVKTLILLSVSFLIFTSVLWARFLVFYFMTDKSIVLISIPNTVISKGSEVVNRCSVHCDYVTNKSNEHICSWCYISERKKSKSCNTFVLLLSSSHRKTSGLLLWVPVRVERRETTAAQNQQQLWWWPEGEWCFSKQHFLFSQPFFLWLDFSQTFLPTITQSTFRFITEATCCWPHPAVTGLITDDLKAAVDSTIISRTFPSL